MITYQLERFGEFYPEARILLARHWEEIALNRDEVPLDVDVAGYQGLDAAGQLQLLTVRLDSVMIGYHSTVVKPHLHYNSTLVGFVDVYYIVPEHRDKPRVALRLFKEAEKALKARGVKLVIQTTKLHSDKSKFLKFLGYQPTEIVVKKIL